GFESLYEQGVRDLLHGTGRETFEAVKMLRGVNAARIAPANGADYPRGQLGEALRQIAQLIKANVGLEVAFADMQGWDTHVGQGRDLAVTTDFRTLFAEGATRHLGAPAAPLFPGFTTREPPLALFA